MLYDAYCILYIKLCFRATNSILYLQKFNFSCFTVFKFLGDIKQNQYYLSK